MEKVWTSLITSLNCLGGRFFITSPHYHVNHFTRRLVQPDGSQCRALLHKLHECYCKDVLRSGSEPSAARGAPRPKDRKKWNLGSSPIDEPEQCSGLAEKPLSQRRHCRNGLWGSGRQQPSTLSRDTPCFSISISAIVARLADSQRAVPLDWKVGEMVRSGGAVEMAAKMAKACGSPDLIIFFRHPMHPETKTVFFSGAASFSAASFESSFDSWRASVINNPYRHRTNGNGRFTYICLIYGNPGKLKYNISYMDPMGIHCTGWVWPPLPGFQRPPG